MPLDELRAFIRENGHLPEVMAEKDIINTEINMSEMNELFIRKIEELTLYILDLESRLSNED